ncbi:MAG: glycosyltransferase [Acidimicrobiia bacterium]
MRVAAVIPARNEAETVGEVVTVALSAQNIDEVWVVDNCSVDATAQVAESAGARVLSCPEEGKGQALSVGVAATDADVLVFLDADLVGLTPRHVERLASSVLDGSISMACGLFDRTRMLNPIFLHRLPILTGQRALLRTLFEKLDDKDVRGYRVEAALNSLCADLNLEVDSFVCQGLFHRTKEQKSASPLLGFLRKMAMLITVLAGYAGYRARRLGRGPGPGNRAALAVRSTRITDHPEQLTAPRAQLPRATGRAIP